ncbi:hypothetical protein CHS0354_000084 [Potamilus streckersoni]|uniref:THD domain-containing protein n=1 Tax=Potamilus streckersoni TaxID=2493646 RepID=A0AAE0WD48_9BIVA|nr:hypothetical protein CHS0354_000084 [Potamilus streckersoni]
MKVDDLVNTATLGNSNMVSLLVSKQEVAYKQCSTNDIPRPMSNIGYRLSICFNIVLTVLAVVFITLYTRSTNSDYNAKRHHHNNISICMPCSALGITDDVIILPVQWDRLTDGSGLCCAKNANHLSYMFRITLREKYDAALLNKSDRNVIAAHFFIDAETLFDNHSIRWNEFGGMRTAFRTDRLNITEDGMLVIPESGLYYVYSFLTYKTDNIPSDSEEMINHYLFRENPMRPLAGHQLLLMDKQTRLRGWMQYQTSYLASTLHLLRGDHVFVGTSNVSAIYPASMSNFFGIFKI